MWNAGLEISAAVRLETVPAVKVERVRLRTELDPLKSALSCGCK
jgi:hypothetical protein